MEFSEHKILDGKTGNVENKPKPSYWDSLLAHFGDLHGLSHVSFGDDGDTEVPTYGESLDFNKEDSEEESGKLPF